MATTTFEGEKCPPLTDFERAHLETLRPKWISRPPEVILWLREHRGFQTLNLWDAKHLCVDYFRIPE